MDAHCVRTCSYTIVIHYYDYKTLEHSDGFWGLGPIPSWRPCKVNKARASSSEDLRRSSKNDPTRISKHLKASLNDLRTWAYPSILNRGHLMSFPCRQILLARAQPRHLGVGMRTFWQLYPSEFVLRWRGSIAASDKRFNKQRAVYNAFHLFIMTLWHLVPYVLSYEDVLPHSCMYVCIYLYIYTFHCTVQHLYSSLKPVMSTTSFASPCMPSFLGSMLHHDAPFWCLFSFLHIVTWELWLNTEPRWTKLRHQPPNGFPGPSAMDSCKTTYETDACDVTSIIIGIGLIAGRWNLRRSHCCVCFRFLTNKAFHS